MRDDDERREGEEGRRRFIRTESSSHFAAACWTIMIGATCGTIKDCMKKIYKFQPLSLSTSLARAEPRVLRRGQLVLSSLEWCSPGQQLIRQAGESIPMV